MYLSHLAKRLIKNVPPIRKFNDGTNMKEKTFEHHPISSSLCSTFPDHYARYIFAAKHTHGVVLELGCGIGLGIDMLLARARGKVVALISLDIDHNYIKIAKVKVKKENNNRIHFIIADAEHLPIRSQSIDSCVAFEVIEHLRHYTTCLNEVQRVLKNEGLFLCSTPNKKLTSPGQFKPGFRWHEHEFTPEELSKVLRGFFSTVTLYGQMVLTPEWSSMIRSRVFKLRFARFVPWFIRRFIPQIIKNKFIGEETFRSFSVEDFIFLPNRFEEAITLLAISSYPIWRR